MNSQLLCWRSKPYGNTEGSQSLFVHSRFGSDLYGDGTRANPYQSIGKAFRSHSRPILIICIGRFSEMLSDGSHGCCIKGDYYGAATFDGAGKYILYGFDHDNLIITNTDVGTNTLAVAVGSGALAGVGRALQTQGVGKAGEVNGVAGSSVLMDRTSLYYGCIGGTSAVKYDVFSRPRHSSEYLLWLGGDRNNVVLSHCTVYDCMIEDRRKSFDTSYTKRVESTIFSKFAMIANDVRINYYGCLFAADAKWYYLTAENGNDGTVTELAVTGNTSEERKACLLTALDEKYEENNVAAESRYVPEFNSCLFSTQTAEEIFNNPDKQDFTLRPDGDGVIDNSTYYGAFPPALNVPIMSDSTGVVGTWDELTASGCLAVESNAICIDEASESMSGEILSKIVTINPAKYQLNGIFTNLIMDKFTDCYSYLNRENIFAAKYKAGDTLPIGKYIAKGSVSYNGTTYSDGSAVVVSTDSTTFTAATDNAYLQTNNAYAAGDILPIGRYYVKGAVTYQGTNISNNSIVVVSKNNTTFANSSELTPSTLLAVEQPNRQDVIYCRYCSAFNVNKIKAADGLQRGGVYLNIGTENITYHGRTYKPGESFVAKYTNETFNCSEDADYEVGIMFDDTRVPTSEWVPAQMFGEYFVAKQSGAILLDSDGIPVSSGNYRSFQKTADGGYSDRLRKTIINQEYVQFAIFVNRYDNLV